MTNFHTGSFLKIPHDIIYKRNDLNKWSEPKYYTSVTVTVSYNDIPVLVFKKMSEF